MPLVEGVDCYQSWYTAMVRVMFELLKLYGQGQIEGCGAQNNQVFSRGGSGGRYLQRCSHSLGSTVKRAEEARLLGRSQRGTATQNHGSARMGCQLRLDGLTSKRGLLHILFR